MWNIVCVEICVGSIEGGTLKWYSNGGFGKVEIFSSSHSIIIIIILLYSPLKVNFTMEGLENQWSNASSANSSARILDLV